MEISLFDCKLFPEPQMTCCQQTLKPSSAFGENLLAIKMLCIRVLTYCGLVTPYGDIGWCQHWLRQWHQAITWTNVDLLTGSLTFTCEKSSIGKCVNCHKGFILLFTSSAESARTFCSSTSISFSRRVFCFFFHSSSLQRSGRLPSSDPGPVAPRPLPRRLSEVIWREGDAWNKSQYINHRNTAYSTLKI